MVLLEVRVRECYRYCSKLWYFGQKLQLPPWWFCEGRIRIRV